MKFRQLLDGSRLTVGDPSGYAGYRDVPEGRRVSHGAYYDYNWSEPIIAKFVPNHTK